MSDKQPDLSAKAVVRDVLSHAQQVMGTPRVVINAGYLGVCFLFLAAFVPVSPLDTPLQVATYAFVAAIPLLALALLSSVSGEYKPGMDRRTDFLTRVSATGMQRVCEFLGPFPVYVGVTAVVWHLAGLVAVVVGYGVLVLAYLASMFVGLISTDLPAPVAEASSVQEAPTQHGEQATPSSAAVDDLGSKGDA